MAGTMHSKRYQQAAQQDEDDLGYTQHPMDGYLDGPTWTTYAQSPASGRQGQQQQYDLLARSRSDESESPRPVSPLRPSEEYERCVPSQEPSPVQPTTDPKHSTAVQYTDRSPPSGGQDGLRKHMWTPMWLSKTVLFIFALVFICMTLATALLFHFSQENNGISTQKEANHYGWKYGPTALLVVVGALWKQVDHHNKMLVPWKELQQGPSPADKSLLLDYVSPIVPSALWQAIKNRHWAVALSITGHLLILGTTVFSTGLLILEPTEVTKTSQDFGIKNEFRVKDPKDVDLAFKVGPAPAQLYYGIHFQGLQYPAGTSENLILPELQLPNGVSDDLNYTLTTEGIRVGLDCEILPITNGTEARMPWKSILGSFIVTNISTSDCNINGVTIGVGPDHNYYHRKNATQNYQGLFGVYPCNVDWNFATQYLQANDTDKRDMIQDVYADQRVVLSVADLRVSPYNVSKANADYFYAQEVKVALCKPRYNLQFFDVQAASLVNNSARAVLSSISQSGRKLVSGLPVGAVARGVETASKALYLGPGGEDYALSQVVPTFFQLMSMKNDNSSVGAFLDPDLLMETGTSVFNGIAAQLMRQLALQPMEKQVAGNISYVENRLHVKAQSTGFMCAFLALLTLIAAGTIFVRPRDVVPHEPGSAATTAAILAASGSLRQTLMNMGSLRQSQIRSRLQGLGFRSVVVPGPEPAFVVEPVTQSKEQISHKASPETRAVPWWWPMAGTRWFLCVTIVLPLLLIAALEIVQRLSDNNDGFVDIGPSDSIVLATYIPAAVVLGVASMYSAVEFMVAVFAPFHALKKGRALAERSISLNMVGKLLPHAAFMSFKTRHFAVLVALLANFIGSFLTIVISGLYSAINVPQVQDLAIQQLDTFNFDNVDLSLSDNQAAAIDSLIEYLDLDYPQWTHEGLVYNHFQPPQVKIENSSTEAPFTITVPAYRPKLNCTPLVEKREAKMVIADAKTNYTQGIQGQNGFTQTMKGYMQVGFNTTLDYAKWCENSPNKNVTGNWWMESFYMPYTSKPVYLGQASIMQWSSQSISGNGAINTNPTTGNGYGANGLSTGNNGCPTFALTLGTVQVKSLKQIGKTTKWDIDHDLNTILCYQNLERVETNLTWSLPDFQFTSSGKPKVDESTASLVKNGTRSYRYEYAINAWLQGLSDSVYNRTIAGPNDTSPAYANIDQFISALVHGKSGRPLEEYLGEEGKEKVAEGASSLYEVYMAQAISLNMRSNSTDSAQLPSYNGTLTTSGHRRLKQNKPTKIALQAMLATMVVCAIATTQLMEVRGVLPHNPCSIAGTATLLAGGEMTTPEFVPPGSEWRNDGELAKSGVFSRSFYTLKWWNTTDSHTTGKQRYGVDVDRAIG
ncbi:hypothetical protein BHE90_008743 [Fusarium euwallaceae]|uniref:Uncharacterized protein n=1 Tax=Fusarium euwallaceae TaxID=1147111 RepID=A0A430LM60_9HYPO|nr:hypothetical protein BHE90_008743 [Fusarium euwallaceae]